MDFKFSVWLLSILALGELAVLQAKKNLLAGKAFCGYQHSDDFHREENNTSITEFPWLVRFAYSDAMHKYVNTDEPIIFTCLGSLINAKYVLTAAFCVTFDDIILKKVRLGEFSFFKDEDCVDEIGVEECSEPVEHFEIEKIIVHPNHVEHSNLFENNIALIRLQKTVTFTDYIRPICLPSPDSDDIKSGDLLTASGWHNLHSKGDVKMTISAQLLSFQDCESEYRKVQGSKYNENNICVARLNDSIDISCVGDYGAPVALSKRKKQWYQEGIVTYMQGRCETDLPVVLTKVSNYYDWIVDNLEP